MFLDIVVIVCIVVFIIDVSGIVDSIKHTIWKWLFKDREYRWFSLKPFDCSLCMSFWMGLIYLLCVGQFNIPMIGFVCLMAGLSGIIGNTFKMITILLGRMVDKLLTLIE